MATLRPAMSGIVFILRVDVHVAYTTSSWPAAVTLCASLAVLITRAVRLIQEQTWLICSN